jgi:signal transduction histidine kinase
MSHELRTPLNAIIGYSEMLQEDAGDMSPEEYVGDLKKIQGAGKHLLSLINDILDLSKVEAGKIELHVERFDIKPLILEMEATLRPLVEKNANTLQLDCPETIGTMNGDFTRVRQVLFNLLSNACKFTEHGVISLAISRELSNGLDCIRYVVRDTGIGMTPDQMKRLFQAFAQADTSTTKKYGGTGLGLAISKRLCELMGGSIAAESEPGRGSVFTVILPAEGPPRPVNPK